MRATPRSGYAGIIVVGVAHARHSSIPATPASSSSARVMTTVCP